MLTNTPIYPLAIIFWHADEDQDEFAEHFKRIRPPNVLITTSYKVRRCPLLCFLPAWLTPSWVHQVLAA